MLGLKLTEMGFRHEFCDIGHRSLTDGGKSIDVSAINNFPPEVSPVFKRSLARYVFLPAEVDSVRF